MMAKLNANQSIGFHQIFLATQSGSSIKQQLDITHNHIQYTIRFIKLDMLYVAVELRQRRNKARLRKKEGRVTILWMILSHLGDLESK